MYVEQYVRRDQYQAFLNSQGQQLLTHEQDSLLTEAVHLQSINKGTEPSAFIHPSETLWKAFKETPDVTRDNN